VEAISTLDIFKIGVGPSSSHTMGPWRAAQRFVTCCRERGLFPRVTSVRAELYGSLAKTGRGHGTDLALQLGLSGEDPVTCDTTRLHDRVAAIAACGTLSLGGEKPIPFHPAADLIFRTDKTLPFHPNGLTLAARLDDGSAFEQTYYSIGGGFVVQEGEPPDSRSITLPLPFETAADLLRHCQEQRLSVAGVVRRNERVWRSDEELAAGLCRVWQTMRECAYRGCQAEGVLPGVLGVVRRAGRMNSHLLGGRGVADIGEWISAIREGGSAFRTTLQWVSCFALAVNEENAAFGRVVTAPTNGAAGVIPAVLLYCNCFCGGQDESAIENFLLAAAAVGCLFKKGATISAALGGCQAEIGVSSAMAAAGLAEVLGGSPGQVLMAAEIAMEHHLGLTCDPIGGLVQVPCIERNTMGAVKAITACQLGLASDPSQAKVPLDAVIRTMWATAQDMSTKYKETSEGGLALQIPVNVSEC
jgi:L-serine dehydratase